jgi:hypothetical protein
MSVALQRRPEQSDCAAAPRRLVLLASLHFTQARCLEMHTSSIVYHLQTAQLPTPWNRALHEELIVAQLVEKFITNPKVHRRVHKSPNSVHTVIPYVLKMHFNIILPRMSMMFKVASSIHFFQLKFLYTFLIHHSLYMTTS